MTLEALGNYSSSPYGSFSFSGADSVGMDNSKIDKEPEKVAYNGPSIGELLGSGKVRPGACAAQV